MPLLYCGPMRGCVWLAATLGLTLACGTAPPVQSPDGVGGATARRHLLVVIDGLRPDYVTSGLMPNLHAIGARGVVFTDHHSVYPTVTRVNAASISTGAYPESHGLLGNAVYFPSTNASTFLSTADRANLMRIEGAASDRLLTAPTLGERLQENGHRLLVVSAGSSGSSYLLNHTVAGGGIIHYDYTLPVALGQAVRRRLGPPPPAATPNQARNRYAVDAFLEIGLDRVDPAVTVLWLSDPDTTAHAHGIGHPTSVAALRAVDAEVARIAQHLERVGRLEEFNIWITSDHGFSTYTGGLDLDALLAPYSDTLADGSPRVVGGAGAIYVRDGSAETVADIVSALQRSEQVGAIFTRDGRLPGTLPFDLIRWNHVRAADILYSPAWTDETNAHGYRGTSASRGTAGHGSASPYDIHGTLIAVGPDLRSGVEVSQPTSNVDFAPTFLTMLGLTPWPSMQGRVLREALAGTDDPVFDQTPDAHTSQTPDGRYRVTARTSRLRKYRYFDSATAERR